MKSKLVDYVHKITVPVLCEVMLFPLDGTSTIMNPRRTSVVRTEPGVGKFSAGPTFPLAVALRRSVVVRPSLPLLLPPPLSLLSPSFPLSLPPSLPLSLSLPYSAASVIGGERERERDATAIYAC